MIDNLSRIAEGKGTDADLTAIRRLLAESEEEVWQGFERLDRFCNKLVVRPRGMEIADKVSEIVRGQDHGKTAIRIGLHRLVDIDLSEPGQADDAKHQAQYLLAKVQHLNKELRDLHGLLLPP